MLTNWKTTLTGVATLLTALAGLLHDLGTGGSITGDLSAILGGIGLVFAKDWNVTGGSKSE